MRSCLVDTDVLIDFLRGKPRARDILLSVGDETVVCCSVITVAEVFAGMRENEREKTEALINSLEIIDITKDIAMKAGEYKRTIRAQHLALDDCLIAACAYQSKTALITGNARHYPMGDIEIISMRHA